MKEVIISLSLSALFVTALSGIAAFQFIKNVHEEIEEPEKKDDIHLFI